MLKVDAQYLGSSKFPKKDGDEFRKADFYFHDSVFSFFLNPEQYTALQNDHDKGTSGVLEFKLATGKTGAIYLNYVSFS